MPPPLSLSKNPGVDKGPQPLMFNPALTTCASERMKTQRFSYFAGFAARERMREAKPVKLKKVAFSHFFDRLKGRLSAALVLHSLWGAVKLSRYSFSAGGNGRQMEHVGVFISRPAMLASIYPFARREAVLFICLTH